MIDPILILLDVRLADPKCTVKELGLLYAFAISVYPSSFRDHWAAFNGSLRRRFDVKGLDRIKSAGWKIHDACVEEQARRRMALARPVGRA